MISGPIFFMAVESGTGQETVCQAPHKLARRWVDTMVRFLI